MTEFFYDLLKASLHGSIVILAVLLLRQLLKKAPKSLFCLLWLLAGLRLVMPFEIESNLSLQPQIPESELSIQAEQPVQVPDILIQNPDGQPLEVPDTPAQTPSLPEGSGDDLQTENLLYGEQAGVITEPISYGDIAAQIWLLGMAVMLAASAVSYRKLKRRVRMAYLIENGCFECPGLETAFVLGFLPPKIYLPAGLTDGEKKFIFDHENTHIARHDHWYKLLGYLVLSLHWFNPLVWVGYSALCRDIELACDEHVVRNMSIAERKAYSAALLSCGGHTARIAACPVAFGESNPKRRILNVLNYKRPTFWISLLAIAAVIFVAVCLLTSPAKDPQQVDEAPDWNLEMTVSDVTPSGLQVQFRQTGIFPGSDRASLQYGSYYTLERWVDGEWEEVEMLPQEYEVAWTMVAYLIDLNSTKTFNVDWEWLYGQLPAGRYRIGKNVDLHYRIDGETEHQMFYSEFEIAGNEPTWNMDMTEEEFLALCRNTVEELQNREQFHISETIAYFTGETEDSRSEVVFWRDGENWLRSTYVTRMRENRNYLYYDGIAYYQTQKESEEPVWRMLDSAVSADSGEPWLRLLRWEEQNITFEGTAQEGDELRVSVNVHSTPPTLGWDDVQEYNILFFFDKTGTMTRAIMTAQRDNIKVIDDLTMETTLGSNIHSKLEKFAAQRPGVEQSQTDEHWQDQCRTALENYQSQGSWVVLVENTFTGDGAMNSYSTALWFIDGQDWYKQAITGSADFTSEHCYLKRAGKTYCRENHTVHDPANGEGFSTGWTEDSQYTDMPLPWPMTFTWDEATLEYVQTEQWDRGERITFTVRGSLYAGQHRGIDSYQVIFWLTEKGELWSIDISYSEKDGMGETTNVRSVITPNAAAPEEAERMIGQCHEEALRHAQGICNDPECTDESHDHSGINCTDENCTNSTHHHDEHHH